MDLVIFDDVPDVYRISALVKAAAFLISNSTDYVMLATISAKGRQWQHRAKNRTYRL